MENKIDLDIDLSMEMLKDSEKPVKHTKNKRKIKGAGDVIKVVTNVLGIEQCDECLVRQEKLNKMFPFTKKANTINNEDCEFVESIGRVIKADERRRFEQLYRDTFNEKFVSCNCPSKYAHALDKLKIQVSYQKDIKNV